MTESAPTYRTNGNGDSFAEFDKPTLKVRAGQYAAGTRWHLLIEWSSAGSIPDAFLNALKGEKRIDALDNRQRADLLLLLNALILAAHEARPLLES